MDLLSFLMMCVMLGAGFCLGFMYKILKDGEK